MSKAILLIAGAGLLSACNMVSAKEKRDPGPMTEEVQQVDAFNQLYVGGEYNVTVTTGEDHGFSMSGPQGKIDDTEVTVEDGRLTIKQKDNWDFGWNSDRVDVTITVPMLEEASLGGSGRVSINNIDAAAFKSTLSGSGEINIAEMAADKAELKVTGSGDLEVGDLTAGEVSMTVTGSGDIKAAGTADSIDAGVMGSGDITARELTARIGEFRVTGSGDIRANVTETASGSTTGSGDILISGGAECDGRSTGSGDFTCS